MPTDAYSFWSRSRGYSFGIAAVLLWSIHNVGTEIGITDGLAPQDLAFLRFSGGMIILVPLLFLQGLPLPRWDRLLLLGLLAGPLYSWIFMNGFRNAPLSHAVVIPPSVSIIATHIFERVFGKARMSRQSVVGISILLAGLLIVGSEASAPKSPGTSILLGDMCFVASGTMWGGYVYLMGRWRLSPVSTATGIAVLSTLAFAPIYFLAFDLPEVSVTVGIEQVIYQGFLGGALALVSFTMAIEHLGAGRASLFFAAVPGTALCVAIPMLGRIPTPIQLLAIAVVMAGIVVSIRSRPSN